DVLEGARDAGTGRAIGLHLLADLAAEGDRPLLRMVEAVDDVEHGGLAGAVRADDGPDLPLADVEGDVGDRLHAAEGQRDVVDDQQRRAPGDAVVRRAARRFAPLRYMDVHSAASFIGW